MTISVYYFLYRNSYTMVSWSMLQTQVKREVALPKLKRILLIMFLGHLGMGYPSKQ
jgi:hypothetical protein